ncbi:ComF family protein [Luteipulveratus flavus]|uniref:Phosphoribosyltransferase family protein n=1 Tax=Luteipulveratus flavus TaxID=3031728 RepID=A0ABT6C1X4_9MICO|nr:phosphoribosyltransferase family protein [Luteipulveratus sp. YIM 133296]MDF8262906.1 phosphoribosyltransferase family protein [Luteipulveratus sp. YIM 133296]
MSVGRALLDLVLPVRCAGCDRAPGPWCALCLTATARLQRRPALAAAPDPCPPGFPPTWAATTYDGPVRQAIVAHKDGGRHDLCDALGAWWRQAVAGALEADEGLRAELVARGRLVVVPVPSSRRSRRERGRDPWREVTERALADRQEARVAPVLQQVRGVADQAGLGAAARWDNLQGAIRVRPGADVRGRPCLLSDDVLTTGATLSECARALRVAGAPHVVAAVLAATPRAPRRTRGRAAQGRLP